MVKENEIIGKHVKNFHATNNVPLVRSTSNVCRLPLLAVANGTNTHARNRKCLFRTFLRVSGKYVAQFMAKRAGIFRHPRLTWRRMQFISHNTNIFGRNYLPVIKSAEQKIHCHYQNVFSRLCRMPAQNFCREYFGTTPAESRPQAASCSAYT